MRKAWGVLVFVFVGVILLRLSWDALQPLLPVIIIAAVIVLGIRFLYRPIRNLIRGRSRYRD
jgi:hypothetical protein